MWRCGRLGASGASFGGSGPKNRDGRMVENGLFPHLDSFADDRHTSPLNIPSEVTSTSSLSRSLPPSNITSHHFSDLCLLCVAIFIEGNHARLCRFFKASSLPSCIYTVSCSYICLQSLLVPSTDKIKNANRSNSTQCKIHVLPCSALLANIHHHDQSHLVFCARNDQC